MHKNRNFFKKSIENSHFSWLGNLKKTRNFTSGSQKKNWLRDFLKLKKNRFLVEHFRTCWA